MRHRPNHLYPTLQTLFCNHLLQQIGLWPSATCHQALTGKLFLCCLKSALKCQMQCYANMMHNWYTNVLHAGLISLTNKYVKAAFQRVKHGHKIVSSVG